MRERRRQEGEGEGLRDSRRSIWVLEGEEASAEATIAGSTSIVKKRWSCRELEQESELRQHDENSRLIALGCILMTGPAGSRSHRNFLLDGKRHEQE